MKYITLFSNTPGKKLDSFYLNLIAKKEKHYALGDFTNDSEKFYPEDPKDKTLRPVVIDKLNKIALNDVHHIRKL